LVGIAVVSAGGLGALAEQGIGLIKEQDPVVTLRLVKDAGEVLLRLTNVLGDHQREIHTIDVKPRGLAKQRRGKCLAGTGRTIKEATEAGLDVAFQSPALKQSMPMFDPSPDFLHLFHDVAGKNEIRPVKAGDNALCRKCAAEGRPIALPGGQMSEK